MNQTLRRPCRESEFASFDRTALFYRHWPAAGAGRRQAIILLHRGHEHGGRMAHLVDELALSEFAFFAWDARGLGRSPGERGYADSVGTLVKDLDAFARHISEQHGIAPADIALVGPKRGRGAGGDLGP